MYPIYRFAKSGNQSAESLAWLSNAYTHMLRHYDWLRRTQRGNTNDYGRAYQVPGGKPEGYRWRGRQGIHCLTSGLDDYPRPSPPHESELHLDLLSWVGWMAGKLAEVAEVLGKTEDVLRLKRDKGRVLKSLDALHWNEDEKLYCDTATYEDGPINTCNKGYITLFPLFLELLRPSSPKVAHLLDVMEHLMTGHGLGSLAQDDPLFGTEENYWRGPIWINMNYLALTSLHNVSIPCCYLSSVYLTDLIFH